MRRYNPQRLTSRSRLSARFPTASTIFVGVLGDCSANSNLIGAADVSRNAAIARGSREAADDQWKGAVYRHLRSRRRPT